MRGMICGMLLMACAGAMAICFGAIWVQGVVKVCEPVLWIRALELVMCVAMATYGAFYFVHKLREVLRRYYR